MLLLLFSLWHSSIGETQEVVTDENPLSADDSETNADNPSRKTAKEASLGISSVLASILYSPLKVTYAALGVVTGGLGYVVSGGRSDVAKSIIHPAVGGTYVITPDHLQGKDRVIFVGPPPPMTGPPQPVATADSATPG